MTVCLARVTLTRAKIVVFQFVSCARFPCVRTHTTFCIAWLNPPTEEGPSPKRLGYLTKFDTSKHFSLIVLIRLPEDMKNSADLGGCLSPQSSASMDNTLLDL